MQRAQIIGLLLVLLTSVPLAYASPPDQTWIGGWYDDADFDNVVLSVTSAVAAIDDRPANPGSSLPVIVSVLGAADNCLPVSVAPSPFQGRAPPHS
jgi:hypothetical protein